MNKNETNRDSVLALIRKNRNNEEKSYLEQYLMNAPLWLIDAFQVLYLEKETVFIRENSPVDSVYFLVEGTVKAIEYRVFGIAYDYMRFYPIKVFGPMEIILDTDSFKTTLCTVTDCKMLVVSRKKFEKWFRTDIMALSMESKSIADYLLAQVRKERIFLFLQGTDRVFVLFIQMYEQNAIDETCKIKLTRQELANCSGLCVKTINRAIKRMVDEGYIDREGNLIIIKKKHYLLMKEYIACTIDQ